MSSKIPLVFAFSNRRNMPAFDVRFLAAKSILLITLSPLFVAAVLFISILTCEEGVKIS
jgi:hypothetical protein